MSKQSQPESVNKPQIMNSKKNFGFDISNRSTMMQGVTGPNEVHKKQQSGSYGS